MDLRNRNCISQGRARIKKFQNKEPNDLVVTVGSGEPKILFDSANEFGSLSLKGQTNPMTPQNNSYLRGQIDGPRKPKNLTNQQMDSMTEE